MAAPISPGTKVAILKSGLPDLSRITFRENFRKCNEGCHRESLLVDYLV